MLIREIEEQGRAERARWLEILRQKIVEERAQVDALKEQATAWQAAQQLRDFVQAVRSAGYYAQSVITGGRNLEAWNECTLDQVNRLDPTVSSPSSVLDYKHLFFWRNGIPCYGSTRMPGRSQNSPGIQSEVGGLSVEFCPNW